MSTGTGIDAVRPDPVEYWEERARRYAGRDEGLGAVCSYGMPAFHNRSIDLAQRLALAPWLGVPPGARVLDLGCGVGRWSLPLAQGGAHVTGVDLSATMVGLARARAEGLGIAERCEFRQGNVRDPELGRRFDLVLAVTVLQHLLAAEDLGRALASIARHVAADGRVVLLEAAPSQPMSRCDTAVFRARTLESYLAAFARVGLRCEHVGGVDPAPFRRWLLPGYRALPRPLALVAVAAATALALPIDLLAGRRWVAASWHKVFVLRPERAGPAGGGGR